MKSASTNQEVQEITRYTFSFAVFLYATTAVIDVILGINTPDQFESYLFRFAAAATIIATYVYLTNKEKPLRSLPLILVSLILSITAIIHGRTDWTTPINIAIKIAATLLTLKPEIIEVEIITEDEDVRSARES